MSVTYILVLLAVGMKTAYGLEQWKMLCSDVNGNEAFGQSQSWVLTLLQFYFPTNTFYTVVSSDLRDNIPDAAYGVGLCRGDISNNECLGCIGLAAATLQDDCQYKTEGQIWFDVCFAKYSNRLIFGELDNRNDFCNANSSMVNDKAGFNAKTNELLSELIDKTISITWPPTNGFGSGKTTWGTSTIYGTAQCTIDLSGDNCWKCLKNQLAQVSSCCDGRVGCRISGSSCMLRYDLYNFRRKL